METQFRLVLFSPIPQVVPLVPKLKLEYTAHNLHPDVYCTAINAYNMLCGAFLLLCPYNWPMVRTVCKIEVPTAEVRHAALQNQTTEYIDSIFCRCKTPGTDGNDVVFISICLTVFWCYMHLWQKFCIRKQICQNAHQLNILATEPVVVDVLASRAAILMGIL